VGKWWSKSRAGFFDDDIHGTKGTKGSKIPKDAVPVTDEAHEGLLAAQAEGERIFPGEDGAPVSGTPVLSPAEVLDQLRLKRDRDLAGSDWTQMGDNGLSDATRAAWAVYRQALRAYIALVEAAIADEQDPYDVPYPTPPQIQAPPAPEEPPAPGGFPKPDNVAE
jgi:hypothetical protein